MLFFLERACLWSFPYVIEVYVDFKSGFKAKSSKKNYKIDDS